MKTLKSAGAVLAFFGLAIVMGLYMLFGIIYLASVDFVKRRFGGSRARFSAQPQFIIRPPRTRQKGVRLQTVAVKTYPAVPGLVMDADGFVEAPADRNAIATPARGLQLVVNNTVPAKSASIASLHGMSASELVAAYQGDDRSLVAFPETAERERLKAERLARQAAEAPATLPSNVTRISDFKPKK